MRRVAEKYYKNPEARKRNALRKAARRIMERKWLVHPFDWKQVDHINWVKAGNWERNLRVISEKKNKQAWQKIANRIRTRVYNLKKK